MQALRQRYNRFAVIHSPVWLLEMGAKLIKTETELILKSRFVLPEKLKQAGFKWKFAKIEDALEEC
jgi:NAD dependent epimerase/dehydratase family enzyme